VARRQVCLVEDVISTGGQVVLAAEEVRRTGATVSIVICVIDRGPAINATLNGAGLELRPLFREAELTAFVAGHD
jgi:orotate phosphoribosyltransferase